MSLVTNSLGRMEDAALDVWNIRPESLGDISEAIESFEFLPLLALCLWHTDLVSVPPFTRSDHSTVLRASKNALSLSEFANEMLINATSNHYGEMHSEEFGASVFPK